MGHLSHLSRPGQSPGQLGLRVAGFPGHWVAGSQNVTQFHLCRQPHRLSAVCSRIHSRRLQSRLRRRRRLALPLSPMPQLVRWLSRTDACSQLFSCTSYHRDLLTATGKYRPGVRETDLAPSVA